MGGEKGVRETEHACHTQIQGKVTSLEGALNEAVNSLLSVEDNNKAANMMQLYMLVTAQLLPFATVVVSMQ